MPRNDPFAQFNFLVVIDDITVAGFTELSGMVMDSEVIEYREGSDQFSGKRKLPGLSKFGAFTLKTGITMNQDLWAWRKTTIDGATQRKNGAIILLDESRNAACRWEFFEAWVSKYEGPALNASTNEAAVESVEITAENVQRVAG